MNRRTLFARLGALVLTAGLVLPAVARAEAYNVENQWGGDSAPWHPGGLWSLGARPGQPVVAMQITSRDGGRTFTGTITYRGEGPIGFRATNVGPTRYTAENQWGGESAPWHPGGNWVIGGRPNQAVVAVDVRSNDNGHTLTGTMTYDHEGPIGFRATSR